MNKQKHPESFKNLINEENQSEDDEEEEIKPDQNEPLSKEEKFFKNAKKIEKNKKSFKFMNEEDDEDDDDVGEFFKEQESTPIDKFETKKQIKRLRIRLMKLLENGSFVLNRSDC